MTLCLLACDRDGQAPALSPAEAEAVALIAAAEALDELDAAEAAKAAEAEAAQGDAGTEFDSDGDREGEAKPRKLPDVIYVPTPELVVDKMLELARVKEDDVVYDLGCGDGRIVIAAAQRYGVKAWGFDIDPARVAEARANAIAAEVDHLVTIEEKDIFTLDLSPASVVTLYLLPELNVRLIPQLEKLKPGSRIVSHDFDIEGIAPLEHVTVRLPNSRARHEVFLWHAPLLQAKAEVETPPPVESPAE